MRETYKKSPRVKFFFREFLPCGIDQESVEKGGKRRGGADRGEAAAVPCIFPSNWVELKVSTDDDNNKVASMMCTVVKIENNINKTIFIYLKAESKGKGKI